MYILRLSFLVISILFLTYGTSSAQTILFGAASEVCESAPPPSPNSTLYSVNPETGASNPIGAIGFDGVTGLAILGDGRLVGSAIADTGGDRIAVLIEIDRTTGQGSVIGEIGNDSNTGECGRVPDITYAPATDTLYGTANRCEGESNVQFIRINQTTGEGTIIGDTGFDGGGNGLAIRADGTIFWASNGVGPAILFTINPNTGLGTQVTNFSQNFPQITALDFRPVTGALFASNINPLPPLGPPNGSLEIVNTTTGALAVIGQLPNCTDALVFTQQDQIAIPTLNEWGVIITVIALGIAGVLVSRPGRG